MIWRSVKAFLLILLVCGCSEKASLAEQEQAEPELQSVNAAPVAWQADNQDGTYTNPPLYADYPDPDIIRVGKDFYFASTTFANVPGLTLLHSHDLVNWQLLSHVMPKLIGKPEYDLKNGGDYRHGVYAPSLRYHQGIFYIVVTPVGLPTRIYSATDPQGEWTMKELDVEAFDPALFFEDDGQAYIATSAGYDGTLTILNLNATYDQVTEQKVVYYNKGAEGSKIIKRGEFYYLFQSIPFRLGMTVSRATSLFGPWQTKNQIDDATGGHQGAIVDLPDGSYYGFVMVDAGSIGRMTNISPIFWQDDWPVWGTPDAPGRVPARAEKPIKGFAPQQPPSSDDFSAKKLGLQWQWNHNPLDSHWSLTHRPGYLRLQATQADEFWTARNTLIQKAQGPRSRATFKVDSQGIQAGDSCGVGTLGKYSALLAVQGGVDGSLSLATELLEDTKDGIQQRNHSAAQTIAVGDLWLRFDMDFKQDIGTHAYSTDGRNWQPIGETFPLAFDWQTGTFQGEQIALFCYNSASQGGYLDIDDFTLTRY